MNFSINTYQSVKQPQVYNTTNITDWLNQIKHSNYSDTITKARLGELDYDSTKLSLPCVTYNFLFKERKENKNIIASTGFLYIDIDNPLFDITSLDKSKVFAYYHSFGGNGYAILVKVYGVTFDNFKSAYSAICTDLGISEFIDVNAVKASQFSILSTDENIYINQSSFVFSASTSTSPLPSSSHLAPPSVVIENTRNTYTTDGGANIRFDNTDEIEFIGDYTVNWNGFDIVKAFMPIKKITINRNGFLLSYTNNLVWLNPNITKVKATEILAAVNHRVCAEPVHIDQIHRVVDSIFKYKADGSLKPIYFNKKRKIVFAKSSQLTYDEKMTIVRNEVAKRNAGLSLGKLYNILEDWDFLTLGSINQRQVYNNNPISKKTVEKYWSQVKEYVTSLNDSNKNKIQIYNDNI